MLSFLQITEIMILPTLSYLHHKNSYLKKIQSQSTLWTGIPSKKQLVNGVSLNHVDYIDGMAVDLGWPMRYVNASK